MESQGNSTDKHTPTPDAILSVLLSAGLKQALKEMRKLSTLIKLNLPLLDSADAIREYFNMYGPAEIRHRLCSELRTRYIYCAINGIIHTEDINICEWWTAFSNLGLTLDNLQKILNVRKTKCRPAEHSLLNNALKDLNWNVLVGYGSRLYEIGLNIPLVLECETIDTLVKYATYKNPITTLARTHATMCTAFLIGYCESKELEYYYGFEPCDKDINYYTIGLNYATSSIAVSCGNTNPSNNRVTGIGYGAIASNVTVNRIVGPSMEAPDVIYIGNKIRAVDAPYVTVPWGDTTGAGVEIVYQFDDATIEAVKYACGDTPNDTTNDTPNDTHNDTHNDTCDDTTNYPHKDPSNYVTVRINPPKSRTRSDLDYLFEVLYMLYRETPSMEQSVRFRAMLPKMDFKYEPSIELYYEMIGKVESALLGAGYFS